MMLKIVLVLVLLCGITSASVTVTYEGYKIYEIYAKSPNEKKVVFKLSENADYDFFTLTKSLAEAARVMVPPKSQNGLENFLNSSNIEFTVVDQDVERTLKLQRTQDLFTRFLAQTDVRRSIFSSYQRYEEINAYLARLEKSYFNRVKVRTVGKSYGGRALKAIIISNGDGRRNKKIILLDAGIHAREWIAPAGALYVIYQLVERFSDNSHLLQKYDWVILPLVNPDGYEYSHTTARLWRKTRKPVTERCYGTDGNRNFDLQWGATGASSDPCSDTFKGVSAFSEPETRVLRSLMHSLTGRAKMYLTLHSFGNYLLYPWGYASTLPYNWQDIHKVAQAGADAIHRATGTQYKVGSSAKLLYPAAGASDDYALGMAKIPVSITMELPGVGMGFNPSPNRILPIVAETWIGIKAMAQEVISKY